MFSDCRGKGPEVQRIHTPPPLDQSDPDTPRKERKRGAKAETWEVHRLCEFCLQQGHRGQRCKQSLTRIPLGNVLTHPRFQNAYKWWVNERWNTKKINRYTRCPNCNNLGHTEEECTEMVVGTASKLNLPSGYRQVDSYGDDDYEWSVGGSLIYLVHIDLVIGQYRKPTVLDLSIRFCKYLD